ncbi:SWIB-domain-containing protein [Wolfiporia cocos MD-104 SS10]|uniref:SWIB-domain-containing protein n=1 Tax=Wolfiporia cocos (strain MD-104) TaxID=742152 RepID=A0A2H3J0C7_WOLCO|nr:SWIB-domain-containing protein [Wolfiporia cocos MD-104 SS10]
MAISVPSLEPQIREILTAPGTDLTTISAKRVRKQLLEQDSSLTADFIKENKEEIDLLIARVYEEVNTELTRGAAEEGGSSPSKRKRAEEANGDEEDGDEGEEEDARPAKTKKARKGMTDEEVARQLSNELNGRARASRTSTTRGRGRGGKRGGKRGAKSAATVDSDGGEAGDSDADGESKKKKTGRRGGGFQKEYSLSAPLAEVVGVNKLSRPQTVKQLWEYIKANGLQNPTQKKEIICDDKMKAIFNVDKIDMFKMNKELGKHLHDISAVAAAPASP